MGNRAVLQLGERSNIGVYLHWNGGRDSVEGFLLATKKVMEGRMGDETYATARLIQVISNFFGGNLSVGVGHLSELDCDNSDNGVYVVNMKTLEVIGRKYHEGEEQKEYDPQEFAKTVFEKNKATRL